MALDARASSATYGQSATYWPFTELNILLKNINKVVTMTCEKSRSQKLNHFFFFLQRHTHWTKAKICQAFESPATSQNGQSRSRTQGCVRLCC